MRRGNWINLLVDSFAPADPAFLEPGPGGELLVARLRLLAAWFVLAWAAYATLPIEQRPAALRLAGLGLAYALVAHLLVTYAFRPWLSYGLVVLDVLFTSQVLRASGATPALYTLPILLAAARDETAHVLVAGLLSALATLLVPSAASDHWVLLLTAVTGLSALLVARGRRLHPLSGLDAASGALKRAAFEDWLRSEAARSRRHDHAFTLAVFEIEAFEAVTRRHGRARAQALLRALAGALRRGVRESDRVARVGPASFAVALLEVHSANTAGRVEALRRGAVEQAQGGPTASIDLGVQVWAGVAGWPEDGDDPLDVLALAAGRLREQRASGQAPAAVAAAGTEPATTSGDEPALPRRRGSDRAMAAGSPEIGRE